MKPPSPTEPQVLDASLRQHGVQFTDRTRGLLLLVRSRHTTPDDVALGFVADVLRASGFAVVSFSLQTAAEHRLGKPPPGMVQSKQRLRDVFEWAAQQHSLGRRPVGLVAIDDAVNACVGVAGRFDRLAVRSLVLLDGNVRRMANQLSRLSMPTLFVIGHSRARFDQIRAATRSMTARHEVDMLSLSTLPRPERGALEAFACSAVNWLNRTLPLAGTAAIAAAPLRRTA
jgi:hypothetical protein